MSLGAWLRAPVHPKGLESENGQGRWQPPKETSKALVQTCEVMGNMDELRPFLSS